MRGSRMLAAAGLLLVAVVLASCSGSNTTNGGTSSGGNTVTMQDQQFSPSTLSVKQGDSVTLDNKDGYDHHVVIGTDDLGTTAAGQTTTWKAPATDGVYLMKCLIHPAMTGQITVGAGGATIGTPSSGGTGGTSGSGGTGSGYSY